MEAVGDSKYSNDDGR